MVRSLQVRTYIDSNHVDSLNIPRNHINFFDARKPSAPLGRYADAHTDLVTKVPTAPHHSHG